MRDIIKKILDLKIANTNQKGFRVEKVITRKSNK